MGRPSNILRLDRRHDIESDPSNGRRVSQQLVRWHAAHPPRLTMVDRLLAHWHENEKLRFLIIGGWNTAFGYFCFLVLYWLLHDRLHYLVIGALAHVLAVANAFVCHRMLVFRSRGSWLPAFFRFNLAQLFVLAGALAGLWFIVTILHVSPLPAQALVTLCSVSISYFAHRHFSFVV
jgi:putative flippase GtrA